MTKPLYAHPKGVVSSSHLFTSSASSWPRQRSPCRRRASLAGMNRPVFASRPTLVGGGFFRHSVTLRSLRIGVHWRCQEGFVVMWRSIALLSVHPTWVYPHCWHNTIFWGQTVGKNLHVGFDGSSGQKKARYAALASIRGHLVHPPGITPAFSGLSAFLRSRLRAILNPRRPSLDGFGLRPSASTAWSGACRWHVFHGRAKDTPTDENAQESGAGTEIRTPDFSITNAALYQLSYSGIGGDSTLSSP